jgi:predicted alpha/beta superfamily hydrolase
MGHLHIVRDFRSPQEEAVRTLRIYTPDAYDARPEARFPVLYMHDGQNVFDHPESARWDTWGANSTLERLARAGELEPWIIVAVDHGPNRFEQYSPWDEPRLGVSGRGRAYGAFLVETLKPWVDAHYRTRPDAPSTATMGSSLGGLASLFLGWRYPQVFGRIGGVSATVMWSGGRLFQAWTRHSRRWSRIYLDTGAAESVLWGGVHLDYAAGVPAFHEQLRRAGYAPWELRLVVDAEGGHHESDWRRRLPDIFRWLLA